jgi:hypothetical protein
VGGESSDLICGALPEFGLKRMRRKERKRERKRERKKEINK